MASNRYSKYYYSICQCPRLFPNVVTVRTLIESKGLIHYVTAAILGTLGQREDPELDHGRKKEGLVLD